MFEGNYKSNFWYFRYPKPRLTNTSEILVNTTPKAIILLNRSHKTKTPTIVVNNIPPELDTGNTIEAAKYQKHTTSCNITEAYQNAIKELYIVR